MSYFADSMRFMDSQFETLFVKLNVLGPDPTSFARPLPSSGPPFPARVPSAVPPPQPGVIGIDPEGVASSSSSSSSSDEDDDGDEKMAEGDAEESSSEEDDDEEGDDGAE